MNKNLSIFLRVILVLIGLAVFAFLLIEPNLEGVNASATSLSQIYFDDPFLAYAYVASITFFIGIYKIFKVLGYAGENKLYSEEASKAFSTIKYSALSSIPFIIGGVVWLLLGESDDRPPLLGMGTLASLIAIYVAYVAARWERRILMNQKSI